jgi:hypothetical protein
LDELGVKGTGSETLETLSIPITPKMREKILKEGQPLFAKGGEGGAVGATQRDDFEELLNNPPQIAPPQPQMPDNYLDAIAQGWT